MTDHRTGTRRKATAKRAPSGGVVGGTGGGGEQGDMAVLVALFVDELPRRVDAMLRHLDEGKLNELRRAAHQLVGSAAGHGFRDVGTAASALESALLSAEADPEGIQDALDELTRVCRDACHRGSADRD